MNDLHEKHFSSSTIMTFHTKIFVIDSKSKCPLQKKIKITYDCRVRNIYVCHRICNICISAQNIINAVATLNVKHVLIMSMAYP